MDTVYTCTCMSVISKLVTRLKYTNHYTSTKLVAEHCMYCTSTCTCMYNVQKHGIIHVHVHVYNYVHVGEVQ